MSNVTIQIKYSELLRLVFLWACVMITTLITITTTKTMMTAMIMAAPATAPKKAAL